MSMEKKLRILAASDLHGDSSQFKRLADKAEKENVDLVILCGDLTSPSQSKDLIQPFKDKGKRVLLVHGNHDGILTGEFLSEFYKIKNLHSSTASYYGVGIFGCGGANVGIDAMSENEIFDTLRNNFQEVKDLKKKIMVTHVHPSNTIVEKIVSGIGSNGVKYFIDKYQPDILLCGHVHEAEGVEDLVGKTKIMNVGRNGKIIEI